MEYGVKSPTSPPVKPALGISTGTPHRRSTFAKTLSAMLYRAQKLGAQYAWQRPLPNGKRRFKICCIWFPPQKNIF